MRLNFKILLFICFILFSSQTFAASSELLNVGWGLKFDLPNFNSKGEIKGDLSLKSNGSFDYDGIISSNVTKSPIKVHTNLKLGGTKIIFKKLRLVAKKLNSTLLPSFLQNKDFMITSDGDYDYVTEQLNLKDTHLKITGFPELVVNATYSPIHNGTLRISTNLNSQNIAQFITNKINNDFSLNGYFRLVIDIRNALTKPSISLKLNSKKLSAESSKEFIIVQDINPQIFLKYDDKSKKTSTKLDINNGEALFDTYYFNFKKNPLTLNIDTSNISQKVVTLKTDLNWDQLIKINSSSEISNKDTFKFLNSKGKINFTNLNEFTNNFLIAPNSIASTSFAGKGEINYKFQNLIHKYSLQGNLLLNNTDIYLPIMHSTGIEAKLPFKFLFDKKLNPLPVKTELPKTGYIVLGKFQAGKLNLTNYPLKLVITSNQISLKEAPPILFSKGEIKLNDFKLNNPLSSNFITTGRIKIKHVPLYPLTKAQIPIKGLINGDLKIFVTKENLSTTGQITGNIFDGDLVISEIFAENMLEPSRQFGCDLEVKNINLLPLSNALDIGSITGRMDFSLQNLTMAYGQPARFTMKATTTKNSSSDREISLKAVNTLSVLGTGSGLSGAGVGLFSSFFKRFPYKKLGLYCRLQNDYFKVQGLIRDDNIEYIIKRPLLFGINVINSNPDNLIRFSDMLKRIQRISN